MKNTDFDVNTIGCTAMLALFAVVCLLYVYGARFQRLEADHAWHHRDCTRLEEGK